MKILPKNKKGLIEAAIGKRECDLIIKNAKIVNVFTGEIYEGSVGIFDGFIAHINCDPDGLNREEVELKAKRVYDAKGKYLAPGLIDAHIHIESTLMTPRNFACAVIPHGTTTVITDPHEIANVYGIKGVEYMHESSEGLPMRQYILAPSCVPSVLHMENAGAEFFRKEIEEMLDLERVIGLGEVMDFVGVVENDDRMYDILDLVEKKDMFIQGHAPFLSGRLLSSYLCGGAVSCHESRNATEARDKMRNGMFVDARESSISKDVEKIIKGLKDIRYISNLTLCTDDREADEILKAGHMNGVLRAAVAAGLHPVDAIRCATINTAREIGHKNLGGIAPGYVADLVILEDLKEFKVDATFYMGELVAENGILLKKIEDKKFDVEVENSVKVRKLSVEDFKLKVDTNKSTVKIKVIEYESQLASATKFTVEELPVVDGCIDISSDNNLKFAAVVNRHGKKDCMSVAVIRNFGTTFGAIGSTVSHDSHNLTVVYDNPEDALVCANDLIEMRGGLTCAINKEIKGHIALPVGGLMSDLKAEDLVVEAENMKKHLRDMGLTEIANPLLRIVTLALIVIPEAKISDMGVVDVFKGKLVSIFE